MLELKKITKIYNTNSLKQKALDNVSINFRKSEFASILGPSGSGKTTLLNIIGGLDKYSSGDLIINNVSTKDYKDRDWDSYRNHRVGFVFQNYNLISHQTVLQNVLLALTLSGLSKKEGINKAKKSLKDVGLEAHIYKKPNQLSGGQMQRVAIARALVNDPDILLADEPTGALDSETSIQIMKLLKEISNNKLVVMVTHNPELANVYSNRIITLKDGKITSDSNSFNPSKKNEEVSNIKTHKTYMSFLTALELSFKNLMTKKGRTILTSLAGSIGIIGIALILSLSTGFQNYIDKIQEDTLSSYPLTITEENADMTSMLLSMIGSDKEAYSKDEIVKERQFVSSMFSSISKNDLHNFKKYLDQNDKVIKNDVTTIKYNYSIIPHIYSKISNNKISRLNPNSLFSTFYSDSITNMYSSYSSVYYQMLDDIQALEKDYDLLYGNWPKEYNEMIIVLSQKDIISDMLVYFLGLRDIDELNDMITKMMNGETVDIKSEPYEFTYSELLNIDLRLINQTDLYKYNSKYNIFEDMSDDKEYLKDLYSSALKIKITGIVCGKDGATSMSLQPGVAYTQKLIDYIRDKSSKTDIVKKQLSNSKIDVFSNKAFDEEKEKSENLDFEDMISIDKEMLSSAFNMNIDENKIKALTSDYMNQISSSITTDITEAQTTFNNNLESLASSVLNDYYSNSNNKLPNPLNPNEEIAVIYSDDVSSIVNEHMKKDSSKKVFSDLQTTYAIPSNIYDSTYSSLIIGLLNGYISVYNQMDKSFSKSETNIGAPITDKMISETISNYMNQPIVLATSENFAQKMTEAKMQKDILTKVGELTGSLMGSLAGGMNVDSEKIAKAFKFNLSEEELRRIMNAMIKRNENANQKTNLIKLGFQDIDEPSSISFYFKSFDSKERFLDFIKKYNDKMEKQDSEEKVIRYTDATGILMSSVKKVVSSVSYVLIAFVSISLVVSSIMIGIITYISVLERTKEIGILRALGASKRNVSSIFSAETFIIGLFSGLIGIGITLILIPIINSVIHNLTNNTNINAAISILASIVLIVLSIILTVIGGLIPSKKASKQDPVIALRSE